MDKFFEKVKNYLSEHYELIPLATSIFFVIWIIGVFREWDWIYNSPIANRWAIYELPFKAQKVIWFIFGLIWLAISLFITVSLYMHK